MTATYKHAGYQISMAREAPELNIKEHMKKLKASVLRISGSSGHPFRYGPATHFSIIRPPVSASSGPHDGLAE